MVLRSHLRTATGEQVRIGKRLDELLKKRNQLRENAVKLIKAAATAEEDAVEATKKKNIQIEEQANIVGKQLIEDMLRGDKQLFFNPTNSAIVTLELKLKELNNEFGVVAQVTEETAAVFKKLKDNIKAQIKEERTELFDPFLGKIKQALDIQAQAQAAFDKGPFSNASGMFKIADRQIEDLFKKEKVPNQFVGLTEAWKKAQTAVAKKDPILMEQLDLMRALDKKAGFEEAKSDRRNELLDQIEKSIKTGNPLQLQ